MCTEALSKDPRSDSTSLKILKKKKVSALVHLLYVVPVERAFESVRVYLCVYVGACICLYVCLLVCMCIRIYVCIYVCMCVCIHVCIYVCICSIYLSIYLYMHTYRKGANPYRTISFCS